MTTLYDRIGGKAAMDAAIPLFYEKVLADKHVARFFENIDMKRQARKQGDFLTMAFGGPNNYTGRNMRSAHTKLVVEDGLDDSHFDKIVEILGKTLAELGVPAPLIGEAAAIAETVREDTLCRDLVPKKSLYDRIGGKAAMDAAVPLFYEKVLADAHVARFFKGIDMKRQKQKQGDFLTMAFGGPNNYTGRNMRSAHTKLVVEDGLDDSHYTRIVELLGKTLAELGVPAPLIGEAAAIAESVRDDCLCRDLVPKKSLYDRIGGKAAMDAAVPLFYEKVLADKLVARFFKGIDMKRQKQKQGDFLTMAFGGPNNYTGRNMRSAHTKLVVEDGLDDSHYTRIVELLGQTLAELGVPAPLIGEAAAIAESVRDDCLCRDLAPRKAWCSDKTLAGVLLFAVPVAAALLLRKRN